MSNHMKQSYIVAFWSPLAASHPHFCLDFSSHFYKNMATSNVSICNPVRMHAPFVCSDRQIWSLSVFHRFPQHSAAISVTTGFRFQMSVMPFWIIFRLCRQIYDVSVTHIDWQNLLSCEFPIISVFVKPCAPGSPTTI